jgi:23S rRNA U2552 (ribose-2'-O)-methylase RlmE/FtsJ
VLAIIPADIYTLGAARGGWSPYWHRETRERVAHKHGDYKSEWIKGIAVISGKTKTNRVETIQIGEVAPHQTDHSESEWTTAKIFAQYLHWLSTEVQKYQFIY